MAHNQIFIHTNQGQYVGGDIIYGTVFLCINHPVASKSMTIQLSGYEKAEWEYHHTEWYTEDGQQKSRTVTKEHKDEHVFFRDSFKLIEYPGGFPVGQYSYPFQYRLPDNLPGVFKKKRKNGLKMNAKIEYKIKCIVDIPHTKHDLICKQHLTIHEKLSKNIEAKHVIKEQTVRFLCCIPRGTAKCDSWMDKNCYMAGETANICVKVNNDSAVNIDNFNVKLIREITLKAKGHFQTFKDIVAQQKYPGTPSMTNKEASCPLPLFSRHKHVIQPGTSGKLVRCVYTVMIEMSIPWCPDLEIYNPVTIYAPINAMWSNWQAPAWAHQAQVQMVNPQMAVPADVFARVQANPNHMVSPQQVHQVVNQVVTENMAMISERSPLIMH